MRGNNPYLFLSGGGNENDSVLLDKLFLSSFSGSKILYIPVAMPGHTITFESCYDWITSTLPKQSDRFLEIDMCTDLKTLDRNLLKKYDAVYVGGGNTYKLLNTIIISGFLDELKDYLGAGGLYYGGSAGAIIAGWSIATVKQENGNNYKFEQGLNMLSKHSIICHYDGRQDDDIRQFIDKYKKPVIAIPERSGLVCDSANCKVIGYENVYLFREESREKFPVNSILHL